MTEAALARPGYIKAASVSEALKHAAAHGEDARYLAGGTDVMTNKFQGNDKSLCLIDITGIPELQVVERGQGFLKIGSLVRLDSLKDFPAITGEFPALPLAAGAVGSPLIRKTATIGGNLLCENRCIFYNQSEWWRRSVGSCLKTDGNKCLATGGAKACFSKLSSDLAPVLISMDAELELISKDGLHRRCLEDIYTRNGVQPRNLDGSILLKAILLPLNRGFRTVFRKLRQRESLEFTSLTTAVSADKTGKLTLAMAGVDPGPVVVSGNVPGDRQQLIKLALKGARTVDNDMYTRYYRREMIRTFLEESFETLAADRTNNIV